MSRNQALLLRVMEECCEVGQRCSKAMNFGINEVQSGQAKDNAERIRDEFADIMGVYKMLADEGILLWPTQEQIDAKAPRVEKYLQLSRERGMVEPE